MMRALNVIFEYMHAAGSILDIAPAEDYRGNGNQSSYADGMQRDYYSIYGDFGNVIMLGREVIPDATE